MVKKLKLLNAIKKGIYLFKVQVFILPNAKEGSYLRIRDEGFRNTMTYKFHNSKTKFAEEHEIIIDNFNNAVSLLLELGLKKKYYYEKIREIWNLNNSEIIFDTIPGLPDIMEIESVTQKELNDTVKLLEVSIKEEKTSNYLNLYGIDLKITDLKFLNVKKQLISQIKKNKEYYNS